MNLEPKRLKLVLKGYPRLSETFIAQEILELERAGIQLDIVSLRHPTDKNIHPVHREISARVAYLPEYLHQEPRRVLGALGSAITRRSFWRCVKVFLRDLRRDFTLNRVRRFGQALVFAREEGETAAFIYAHFLHTPCSVARYAAILSGNKFAISAHAKDIWTIPDWEIREKLDDCEWLVTCTASGAAHLKSLSRNPEKVKLVYHGLDLSRFPLKRSAKTAARNGSRKNQPIRLLTVGRAVHKKGIDVLLAALAELPVRLHWTWTHIGGGPLKSELEARAEKLGISDRCNFAGAQPQEKVLKAYRESDLFILPSRIDASGDRDGLPNVVMEAQSQQLAVISTNLSGIPELIENEKNGVLIEPDNVKQLARQILKLSREPDLRRQMGEQGRKIIENRFSHTRTNREIIELLSASTGHVDG